MNEDPVVLIEPPRGSVQVRPNRVIRLHDKCIQVWENQSRPGWAERWMQVASIIAPNGEQEWFTPDELPEDYWVALAYFWRDLLGE